MVATLRAGGEAKVLAGGRFQVEQLPAAIDRLAWAARLALGEAAALPTPVAAGTSPQPVVVSAVDDAQQLLRDGGLQPAWRALRDARVRDGGAPFVLDGVAALQMVRGELAAAERTAREALGYEERLLPTTRLRLARTLLLARASLQPATAEERDRDLLQLGLTAQRERPHDPEATLCVGILNARATGNRTVFLTLLGGGAFGNMTEWISDAIRHALSVHRHADLDVAIVSHGTSREFVRTLAKEYSA